MAIPRKLVEWPISRVLVAAILSVSAFSVLLVGVLSFVRAQQEVTNTYLNAASAVTRLVIREIGPSRIEAARQSPDEAERLQEILREERETLFPMGIADVAVIVREGPRCVYLANSYLPGEAPPPSLLSDSRLSRRRNQPVEPTKELTAAFSGEIQLGRVEDAYGSWIVQYNPLPPFENSPAVLALYMHQQLAGRYMLRDLAFGGFLTVLLALLVALLLAIRLSRRLTAPIREVVKGARDLKRGRFETRVPVVGRNELTELALAFNEMASGLQERNREILETQRATLFALAFLADKRSPETGAHLYRTREYCNALARALGRNPEFASIIDEEFLGNLDLAAPLHDVGKVAIPDAILQKPGELTAAETELMRRHVSAGADTLRAANLQLPKSSPLLSMAEKIARYHHEYCDGSGYPGMLKGEGIPLEARIFAVADVYDALRSERVYKPALPHEEVKQYVVERRGRQFCKYVVDAFLEAEPEFVAISDKHWPADYSEASKTDAPPAASVARGN